MTYLNDGYQMYHGDGTLAKTDDPNTCYVIRVDSLEGAKNLTEDFRMDGYSYPNLQDFSNEDFPLVCYQEDDAGNWIVLWHEEDIMTIKTVFKLIKKIEKEKGE